MIRMNQIERLGEDDSRLQPEARRRFLCCQHQGRGVLDDGVPGPTAEALTSTGPHARSEARRDPATSEGTLGNGKGRLYGRRRLFRRA